MIGLDISPGMNRSGPASPLADYFRHGGGQSVGLAVGPAGTLSVWTEVAPGAAAHLRFDNGDTTTRYSWRETLLMTLRNIYPVGDLTLLGSWSQLQSSGSGVSSSYVGNRAISTSSLTASAEVTVARDAPYDLWICYTGRTSGGYCRVDIDGDQSLVTEIDDPAMLGFKAFSTYTPVDLQRQQAVKVATGLTGSHVVTIQNGGIATPGGNAIMVEAVAISGALADARILPPIWQPSTAYEMGDEVQLNGTFYAARANSISGVAGPLHTSGIATDGAMDWRADNRTTYQKAVAIDYASEREYAVRFSVSGATTEAGGQTHGNEVLQTRSVMIDGVLWSPSTTGSGISVGTQIDVVEDTIWQQAAGGDVANCQLTRTITPGSIRHDVAVAGTGPEAVIEWLYSGMVPMVRWDGEAKTTVADTVEIAGEVPIALIDYAGVNPPNLEHPATRRIAVSGSVVGTSLSYGLEVGKTPASGNRIGHFDGFVRPNLDATSEGGSLDWKMKGYIAGVADGGALTVGLGDTLGFFSRHVMRMD